MSITEMEIETYEKHSSKILLLLGNTVEQLRNELKQCSIVNRFLFSFLGKKVKKAKKKYKY